MMLDWFARGSYGSSVTQLTELVGRNVAALRNARGLTTRALADKLEALGHRIAHSSLSKIEQGSRAVDVQDLVALALALGVNPNRLLLPPRADDTPTQLTPAVTVPAGIAWYWADGSLPVTVFDDDRRPEERAMEFRRAVRPIEHQVNAEHPAHRAAQQVKTRVDQILDANRDSAGADRVSELAANLRRSLPRLVAEVRDLLADHKPHEPALLQIVRDDGFTGEDQAGVYFANGETVLRENDARAHLFTGPGYRVNRISMEPIAAAMATPTFADFLADNPLPEEEAGGGER